ncbi:MAG TPA: nucleoside deaminase [Candidatus Gallimonas intestinavium]|uniref:tRNA-specific adenosine deaminase n=1 Tax=Candidatus Gallimonas intestinavium TaxID=2838603 RepID=A0A9D2JZE5_9FIRM|nr:nucleoside deaminase [Candidatus Gallimonas intestinavium]
MEEKFMREAIKLAERAKKKGEVPIGAVVVLNGKIIGKGYNLRTRLQMATAHAEMRAIDRACKKEHSWRLPEAELYVTLEPCPMCMGAILNARIRRVYFGAYEQKGRSLTDALANANLLNHKVEVVGGVLEEACSEVLTSFFTEMRAREKAEKERKKAKRAAAEAAKARRAERLPKK